MYIIDSIFYWKGFRAEYPATNHLFQCGRIVIIDKLMLLLDALLV